MDETGGSGGGGDFATLTVEVPRGRKGGWGGSVPGTLISGGKNVDFEGQPKKVPSRD